jgi:CheY-like chemotaxis protein
MDHQMPKLSGIDACRLIVDRKDGKHPTPKIVFVTAHAMNSFKNQCISAGGTEFLPKPFNIKDIEKLFQRLYALDTDETLSSPVRRIVAVEST